MEWVWNEYGISLKCMESIWNGSGMDGSYGMVVESLWNVHYAFHGIYHPFRGLHHLVHGLHHPFHGLHYPFHIVHMHSIRNDLERVKYCLGRCGSLPPTTS